jgi:phytoene dehydrogenase-like protein
VTGRDRADAVVVGAGPNGLSAAIRLARAGRDVVVLEAQPRPGGGVVSDELTLPGFVSDTFSAVHPAAAASPVFARMPLAEHGLAWVHPEYAMAHPLPDGRAGLLHRDLDRTAAHLDDLHPGTGRRGQRGRAPTSTTSRRCVARSSAASPRSPAGCGSRPR